jgi:hypothetical protein
MIVIETAHSVKEMYFEVRKIDLNTIRRACIFSRPDERHTNDTFMSNNVHSKS